MIKDAIIIDPIARIPGPRARVEEDDRIPLTSYDKKSDL
jgi:hypothetical protein